MTNFTKDPHLARSVGSAASSRSSAIALRASNSCEQKQISIALSKSPPCKQEYQKVLSKSPSTFGGCERRNY